LALNDTIERHSHLEKTLPKEARQSSVDAWGEKIVETDAPEWITSERAVDAAHDNESNAACEILGVIPTTMAGVIALLSYATEVCAAGMIVGQTAWSRRRMIKRLSVGNYSRCVTAPRRWRTSRRPD
jgi:hypothetical protein